MSRVSIRAETAADRTAVHQVHLAAFEQPLEAALVDRLRHTTEPFISLVAEVEGEVVGHILFTPVTVGDGPDRRQALGLAPMAVAPEHQRCGIGQALIEHGLEVCRTAGHSVVVVLGHSDYYPRFGFEPASRYQLQYEVPVPDEAFMVLELVPGALAAHSGTVRYHPEFSRE